MRNVLMVAIAVALLVFAGQASFAGDTNLTLKATAKADTAVGRISKSFRSVTTERPNQAGETSSRSGWHVHTAALGSSCRRQACFCLDARRTNQGD